MSRAVPNLRSRRRRLRRALLLALTLSALGTCLAFAEEVGLGSLRAVITREYPEVAWIRTAELARTMRRPIAQRPRLLDARAPAEYAVSHLEGATRVDPDATDARAVEALGVSRGAAIVVYCSVGYRSARVARVLRAGGFVDVRNLEGGIFAWANEGRPVVRGRRIVHDVHPYDETWGRLLAAPLRTRTPR